MAKQLSDGFHLQPLALQQHHRFVARGVGRHTPLALHPSAKRHAAVRVSPRGASSRYVRGRSPLIDGADADTPAQHRVAGSHVGGGACSRHGGRVRNRVAHLARLAHPLDQGGVRHDVRHDPSPSHHRQQRPAAIKIPAPHMCVEHVGVAVDVQPHLLPLCAAEHLPPGRRGRAVLARETRTF